ncbi:MAG: hypothetical protein ACK52I_09110, partial [Pseudomonadota bacterium]
MTGTGPSRIGGRARARTWSVSRSAAVIRARRKFKQRSRTTRDPPPRFYPLRATPSTRPQPPARTDPRPHATAFPP